MSAVHLIALVVLAMPELMVAQTATEPRGAGVATTKGESKQVTQAKLNELLFTSIDFKDSKLSLCIDWLKAHKVPIEMGPDVPDEHAPVNLVLRDATAAEVVEKLAAATKTRLVIANGRVTVRSAALLPIQQWTVSAGIFGDDLKAGQKTVNAKPFLAKHGIEFPPHAFAMFNGAQNVLVVKQTEENLVEVDRLVRKLSGVDP